MSLKPQKTLKSNKNKTQNEIILNFVSEGVCQLDTQGVITYCNRSAHRMLSRSQTGVIGRHYAEVFFADDKESYAQKNGFCPIDFVLNEGEISHVNTESFYKYDSESWFVVEYMCVPVLDTDGIEGAVISFKDISERKDVEIALSKARDASLEAAKAKAAFLANMSHEIRTPLSGIVGTAGLLLDSNLTQEQQKYTEMLKKSTDLLSQIVNDILDFSKIEAGKFEREKLEFDSHAIIFETVGFFKTFIQDTDIYLNFDIDKSVPRELLGDVQSIQQILNNFVSNAIKFTEKGEVLLQVATTQSDSKKARLRFSVKDSGIGIKRETQDKLFQPFTQADSSITRKFGGTGLGLAICRQLVDLMGGEIGVDSVVGEGSTFWFECDFTIGKMNREEMFESIIHKTFEPDKVEKHPAILDEKFKILIAEDNPTNREITSAMFKQLGLNSKTVENGLEAVKACQEEEFDLILMDCHMPQMDGFKASSLIREKVKYINKPKIIAFTASITISEREKCFSYGMDDFLSKPFTKQDLLKVLEKHFQISTLSSNLDLDGNMIQHSLSNLIEPRMLQNLLEIEANGQKGFIFEILNIFLKHAEEKIAESEDAIINQNREVLIANSHNLKGSGANVGLINLSRLFEELETVSIEDSWNEIENLFNKIKKAFIETKQQILERKP